MLCCPNNRHKSFIIPYITSYSSPSNTKWLALSENNDFLLRFRLKIQMPWLPSSIRQVGKRILDGRWVKHLHIPLRVKQRSSFTSMSSHSVWGLCWVTKNAFTPWHMSDRNSHNSPMTCFYVLESARLSSTIHPQNANDQDKGLSYRNSHSGMTECQESVSQAAITLFSSSIGRTFRAPGRCSHLHDLWMGWLAFDKGPLPEPQRLPALAVIISSTALPHNT